MGSIALSSIAAAKPTSVLSLGKPASSQLVGFDRDPAREEIVDFALTEPGLLQDLARMLTQPRRRMPHCTVGIAEPHRQPNHPDTALCRMIGQGKEIYRGQVFIRRQLGKGVDRSTWNIG